MYVLSLSDSILLQSKNLVYGIIGPASVLKGLAIMALLAKN